VRIADKLDIDLYKAAGRKIAINARKYPATRCGGVPGNIPSTRREMQRVMKQRVTLLIILLITICASAAFAGSGYDDCRKEEKRLVAAEAEQCSGLSYIFNPSACFNTRKRLRPTRRQVPLRCRQ